MPKFSNVILGLGSPCIEKTVQTIFFNAMHKILLKCLIKCIIRTQYEHLRPNFFKLKSVAVDTLNTALHGSSGGKSSRNRLGKFVSM